MPIFQPIKPRRIVTWGDAFFRAWRPVNVFAPVGSLCYPSAFGVIGQRIRFIRSAFFTTVIKQKITSTSILIAQFSISSEVFLDYSRELM